MPHDDLLVTFIIVALIALIAQAAVMIMMAAGALSARKEVLRILTEIQRSISPLAASSHELVTSSRQLLSQVSPKVKQIADNLAETSEIVKTQATNIHVELNEVLSKVHDQVERVDTMTTSTLDAIVDTRNRVQRVVDVPLRIATGVFSGLAAGIDRFFTNRGGARASDMEDELEPANELYE